MYRICEMGILLIGWKWIIFIFFLVSLRVIGISDVVMRCGWWVMMMMMEMKMPGK